MKNSKVSTKPQNADLQQGAVIARFFVSFICRYKGHKFDINNICQRCKIKGGFPCYEPPKPP